MAVLKPRNVFFFLVFTLSAIWGWGGYRSVLKIDDSVVRVVPEVINDWSVSAE